MTREAYISHLIPGLRRYVDQHVETGGFLRSVLEDDLAAACGRASDLYTVYPTLLWLLDPANNVPPECWGSRERVSRWLAYRVARSRASTNGSE